MLGGNLSECRCLPPESLTAPLMVADVLEDQQACQKWRSAEVAYPGIGAFRDTAWKFHRPVSCRKYCSNVSSRSFLIHVSSGKLTQGMEERESVFFFFLLLLLYQVWWRTYHVFPSCLTYTTLHIDLFCYRISFKCWHYSHMDTQH